MSQPLNPAQSVENLSVAPETLAKKTNVTCVADVSGSLAGKYVGPFDDGAGGSFYFWFKVSGSGADPGIAGSTAEEVDISTNDIAADNATALAAKADGLASFVSAAVGAVATITNAAVGDSKLTGKGNAGFTVADVADQYSPHLPVDDLIDDPQPF